MTVGELTVGELIEILKQNPMDAVVSIQPETSDFCSSLEIKFPNGSVVWILIEEVKQ